MKIPASSVSQRAVIPFAASRAQAQVDQRPATSAQRQVQQAIAATPRQVIQRQQVTALSDRKNTTGLPNQLKAGMEGLSGHSLDDARVHYNSGKPAQLQALAYAQGTAIHLGPGQERHLPHEAGHVVQQKQGRVRPTGHLAGIPINDTATLKNEATRMGGRAGQNGSAPTQSLAGSSGMAVVQRVVFDTKKKTDRGRIDNITAKKFFREFSTHPDGRGEDRQKFALHLHQQPEEYNRDELFAAIEAKIANNDPVPDVDLGRKNGKRKRETPTVKRQTKASVGSQVPYATDPKFRDERRVIRRMRAKGLDPGDKNLYLKRYERKDGSRFKVLTSSIPPSALPPEYDKMDIDVLTEQRLGQGDHSEGVTDQVETNHSLFSGPDKPKELYSASSREQCEKCRYNYRPDQPHEHVFSTFYSGTTDHIEDPKLQAKIVAANGKYGSLVLSKEEKMQAREAAKDAKAARQHDSNQNPALTKFRKAITTADSDGEYSSDEDTLFLGPGASWLKGSAYETPVEVPWGNKGKTKKVQELKPSDIYSAERFKQTKSDTENLLKTKKNPRKRTKRAETISTVPAYSDSERLDTEDSDDERD